MSTTYFPLNVSGKAAVGLEENGVVTVEKLRTVGGGTSIIHLKREEALNLFAALGEILGRDSVGDYVPVWKRDLTDPVAAAAHQESAPLKWKHQAGEAAKAWRLYKSVQPEGTYTLVAHWSRVYEGKVDSYEVSFWPTGGDHTNRRTVGRARAFTDAKRLAAADYVATRGLVSA